MGKGRLRGIGGGIGGVQGSGRAWQRPKKDGDKSFGRGGESEGIGGLRETERLERVRGKLIGCASCQRVGADYRRRHGHFGICSDRRTLARCLFPPPHASLQFSWEAIVAMNSNGWSKLFRLH